MLAVEEAGKLRLITENQFICNEVELRLFNGHSVGQIVSYIHSGEKTYIYVGDVIPLAASLPVSWVSAYDTYPVTSMEDKKQILDEAVAKHQILVFEHDAYTECCTIKEIYGKYRIDVSFPLF